MRWIFVAAMTAITAAAAQPTEKPTALKRGPGLEKVVAHCSACHSLDYIPMNAGFLDSAGWNAEVAKMINSFGAPVDQADAKAIAEYLAANYGPPQLAAPPAAEGGLPRQEYAATGVRPKGPAAQPAQRFGIHRSGLHAMSRRRPEGHDPFRALFAMFEPQTCKPAKAEKHRARCETWRASDPGRRPIRW